MKRILIPTDYTPESLQLIEYAFLNFPDTRLDIVLLAGCKMFESKWRIMHFTPQDFIYQQMNDEFIQEKRHMILEHKGQLGQIQFELFTGSNSFAFQNFLLTLDADTAVLPDDGVLMNPDRKWFDTTSYLRKSVANIIQAPVERRNNQPARQQTLFNSLFDL
ncbi:hypothetical protein FUA23_11540 [Neolewinella aurantiaca]|uniref:Uncharacterized protein n=1 Tax=Neolewinella aurantiaca TaxID=2602767 RepID=A0A5C7FH81_9BACT|nr:hypothetical protein [Neolewinella aurantiaca]TXF89137.1 hypothetical protein FUA23_11540 [Neolewinella aurantiaca]